MRDQAAARSALRDPWVALRPPAPRPGPGKAPRSASRPTGPRLCSVVLASAFLLCLSCGVARAAAGAATSDTPAGQPQALFRPCDTPSEGDGWLDRAHEYVSEKLCEPVAWFDDFFGDERFVQESPRSFARLTNEMRWSDSDGFSYRARVNASVRLPKASRRLRLVIAGENEEDPTRLLPRSAVDPSLDPTRTQRQVNVGFRYYILESAKSNFSLSAYFTPKVQGRYRYAHPIGGASLWRFTQTAFWSGGDGFGETSLLDLERVLDERTLLRWSNAATVSEESDGTEWGSELSLFHQFTAKSGLLTSVGVAGVTDPNTRPTDYRIATRFRRNFYRPWLFYEVEPEVRWPREEDGSRDAVPAITLRLELDFGAH